MYRHVEVIDINEIVQSFEIWYGNSVNFKAVLMSWDFMLSRIPYTVHNLCFRFSNV
jgi:hypothetical protein